MKKLFFGLLAAAVLTVSAQAQPPTPPPTSYYPPTSVTPVSISVTTAGNDRALLPASPSAYPVITITNVGSTEVFCKPGVSTVTASSSSYQVSVPANSFRALWDNSSTYVACATASSTSTVRITQSNGAPQMGYLSGSGGGGSPCTGGFCTATAPLAPNLGGNGLDNSASSGIPLWTAGSQSILGTTGSGSVARSTSPAFTTPNLGTPSAATLTNATGLPISTGVAGLGTGVASALAIAKDTTGGFCTVGGGACSAGGGSSTITQGNGILVSTSGSPCNPCTISTTVSFSTKSSGFPYTILAADGGKVLNFSDATASSASLPVASTSGYTSGFGVDIQNINTGAFTLTATTSVFDNGLTTLVLNRGQYASIMSDGTNYHSAVTMPVIASGGHILANTSGAANYPVDTTATALLDAAFSSTQGTILYRGASAWSALAPGTSGYFLKTQGAGADPTWASTGGGGGGCTTSGLADQALVDNGSGGCTSRPYTFPSVVAAHQLFVGTSSSTFTAKTIPDCQDTGGNHLNFTQGSDSFSCGTSGSGGGSIRYVSTYWYWGVRGTVGTGGTPGTLNIRWLPYYFENSTTISAIGARITTASAGGNCQFAVYANNNTTMRPTGSALASTSNVSTASATNVNGSITATAVNGWVWFAIMCDNGTVAFAASASGNTTNGYMIGGTSQGSLASSATNALTIYNSSVGSYGTWPTNPTVTDTNAGGVGLWAPMFQVQ